jgi:DNA-binding NtrC family response regulator
MPFVFQSQAMQQLFERAKRFARTSATVLLTGESGTGKDLLAQVIHQQSSRKQQPYVRINCAAFSENLIESELFGHEAGAFTGAQCRRIGRFEAAGTGTVFLDEIGELPLPLQAKLLRVLEEREYQRVGSNADLQLEARIVAATNRDLEQEVRRERFRQDLFYRLNVLTLHVPPLRERREDIPALVNFFVQLSQPELERPVRGVSKEVMRKLCRYDWPGNVRELKNVVLRLCVLAGGEVIEQVELPPPPPVDEQELELPEAFHRMPLEEIERQVILSRLRIHHGNKTEAAAALGVTPRTLRNKVTQYRKLGFVS